jgi:hypothetical protein
MAVRVTRMVKALPCDGCGKTATAYIMAVRDDAPAVTGPGQGGPRSMRLCDGCGGSAALELRDIVTAF